MQGYHALQAYRVAHWLWNKGSTVLALALQARMSEVHFISLIFVPFPGLEQNKSVQALPAKF